MIIARILPLLLFSPLALAGKVAFVPHECEPKASAAGARCGVVYVPENHARPRDRRIALNVVILPATGSNRDHRRAQYDLEGGPGFAVTDFVEFYAGEGAAYRVSRDIVLADMRGTGKSTPLRCAGIEERDKLQPTASLYPPDLVAKCARQLRVEVDPAQFTTTAAARDIDLIRQALGYEQLDLNAISYGTTLALRYMADFPKQVHAAVLMGTVPAHRTPPRFHALAAERSFQQLALDCAASSPCREQFGDVIANLQIALDRVFAASAIPAPVFMERLRNLLYAPFTRAHVPALLARAAKGDFKAFAERASNGRVFADGLYLSITCAESFPQMDVDAAIEAARATRFGPYRLENQQAACEHWPNAPVNPKLMLDTTSTIPTLFLAGALDPVSPPEWAIASAQTFANGRVVIAPQGAHVFDGLTGLDTCLDATVIRFLDAGSARDLDVSCFDAMAPPPFGEQP